MNAHRASKKFCGYTFEYEILVSGETKDIWDAESKYVEEYDTFFNGLNETISGKGNHRSERFTTYGYRFSEESRKKMSAAKVGYIPWNKGLRGKYKLSISRRGKIHSFKLKTDDYADIRRTFETRPDLPIPWDVRVGNGKILTYERAFCKVYASKYKITPTMMYKILTKRCLR